MLPITEPMYSLPTNPADPYPPIWCARTLATVAEADQFLADAAETEFWGDWGIRRSGWWSGSRPYYGEQAWVPSAYLYTRRRVRAQLNQDLIAVTVPVARELVAFSASQVVASGPSLFTEDDKIQLLLDKICYETELNSTLNHAAEWAAAYGGVYFRVVDTDPPMITVVRPDLAVPVWQNGKLMEVTFETKLMPPEMDNTYYRNDNTLWWRLLERYFVNQNGMAEMECALYASSNRDTIGHMKPLTDHPAVAYLTSVMETRGMVGFTVLPLDHIPVHYVPNMRSRFTSAHIDEGRSDLSAIIDLLRTVDMVSSSVVEEIQIGKPKIIVPEQFITTAEGERMFDEGLNVFTGVMADPMMMSEANMIKQVEFTFNHLARIQYTDYFKRLCVQGAGWSPQDFGYDMRGYAESGTALRERKLKSLNTQARKREHFGPPLERAVKDILLLAGVPENKAEVKVEFPAAVAPADIEKAEILERQARSGVLSRYEMIRQYRPEWTEEQIEQELAREPGGYGAPDDNDGPADNMSTQNPGDNEGGGRTGERPDNGDSDED